MSEPKLLRCPFCGGEAKSFDFTGDERDGYRKVVTIVCIPCGASVSAAGDTSRGGYANNSNVKQQAVVKWNTRANPEHGEG